jgi:hypothetical protein
MEIFELYFYYVSWGESGKTRPVLIFEIDGDTLYAYPVTSQYENKSEYIKRQYFPIRFWEKAGLSKPSYVDTGNELEYSRGAIDERRFIGKLDIEDIKSFIEFIQ